MVPLVVTIVVDRESGSLGMVSTVGANGDVAGDLDTILLVLPQVQASLMQNRLQAEREKGRSGEGEKGRGGEGEKGRGGEGEKGRGGEDGGDG